MLDFLILLYNLDFHSCYLNVQIEDLKYIFNCCTFKRKTAIDVKEKLLDRKMLIAMVIPMQILPLDEMTKLVND